MTQERYTWRHDSILLGLVDILRSNLDSDATVHADLPRLRASDNPPLTVPLSLVPTTARPDIIIQDKDVQLLELTIPTNTSEGLRNARARKQSKQEYISLVNDLLDREYSADLDTIEIGSLRHFEKSCITILHGLISTLSRAHIAKLLLNLCRIAITCSRHIFLNRNCSTWSNPPLLTL